MLNIKYSNKSYENIDKFIVYLKDYYKRIYFDTGIVDENQIVSAYMEKTDKLFDEIIDTIEGRIEKGVFGIILEINENYDLSKLVIQVRSYTIVVIIKKDKEIYIENILIYKKAILKIKYSFFIY